MLNIIKMDLYRIGVKSEIYTYKDMYEETEKD